MKVLIVSNGFPPRGSFGTEFYTAELARGLAGRGHEVSVLHPERSGSRARYTLEDVVEAGIPITLLHNAGDPGKGFEASYADRRVEELFAGVLDRSRPDVVHFLYLLWGLSLGLPAVARERGIPSVVTVTDYGLVCHRGQMFDHRLQRCFGPHPPPVCARCIREPALGELAPPIAAAKSAAANGLALLGGLGRVPLARDLARREAAVRAVFRSTARLIAPPRSLAAVLLRAGAPGEKVVPLLYAFDEAPYRANRDVGPPARTTLGYLGQFAPHKGFTTLLEAARLLGARARDREWELVLHGTLAGRQRRSAERALQRIDRTRVRLGGSFAPAEAPAVLARLSALVVPSEWDENAPLAVLQARACGLPVVASDVPGIAEIVADAVHGRLFPPGDADALAGALEGIVRGELRRPLAPGLPLGLGEHLDRLEALYGAALAEVRAG